MKLEILAIFDTAARAYLPPFVVASVPMAVRQIQKQMERDKDHDFVKFGEQFVLYRLGSFDNETGQIEALLPESFGSMLKLLKTGAGPEGVRDVAV